MPWAPDVQVVYEHLHRYLWAARLVEGRRVLDLASGEGFGAAILAESAESVTGIDLDAQTVDHSALNYGGERIDFQVGDAGDLSRFASGSFGVVVGFEMIEHVEDQQRVLDEIARVLEPDGLLIMSTPDRRAYSEATGQVNPFHIRELDHQEFVRLLEGKFEHAVIWGQRTITGSAVSTLDCLGRADAPVRTFFVERDGDEWRPAGGLSPLYLVAVASNAELPAIPSDSTLADCGLELVRRAEAEGQAQVGDALTKLSEARSEVLRLIEDHDRERRELNMAVAGRDVELELRRRRLEELVAVAQRDAQTIADLRAELGETYSVTWRIVARVRRKLIAALGGERSLRTRALRRVLREATGPRRRPTSDAGLSSDGDLSLIELPEFAEPRVTIVIPLYSGGDLTRACLESIRDNTSKVSYEVILIDDTADESTKALLAKVRGARILVNETNLGYVRSVNRGASEARGRWLVLCNNDIEVREGWLEAMLRCAESPDVAVVTPKYLYPNMSLSEAGGIIWRDGTGGNYGRGENPGDCHYEFRREVDYGSAAALMVRSDFWREVGGFDQRFAPMYYEDTDLCFQAREHRLRVVYEPRANVIHVEGGTAGTDVNTGHKRHQELNRTKFVEKWRRQLERDQLRASEQNTRRASNRHRGPHVLIVDHRVPMWDRDAGSLRMRGMIQALTDLGCRITFFPEDRHLRLPYTVELMNMGVEVWYGDVDVVAELAAIGPGLALVVTCRPHTTSRWLDLIRECAPSVPVVYDTVDLHWLREARRAATADGSRQIALGPKAVALREIELALIRATDATLVVSAEERAQVEADVPGAAVRVVPIVNEVRAIVPPARGRRGVLFIGGFEHTPNVDAALRLVQRVMPRVWRELGQVPVTIVGGSVPPEVEALASPLVDVAGWVPDVDPLFDTARAMVAPLSYGAGLKGKVTQALAAGLPVVTTAVGAEGLDAVDGEQLLISDDDGELAGRVIRALTDDDLWATLSSSGQRLAAERCSPSLVAEQLRGLLRVGASPELDVTGAASLA